MFLSGVIKIFCQDAAFLNSFEKSLLKAENEMIILVKFKKLLYVYHSLAIHHQSTSSEITMLVYNLICLQKLFSVSDMSFSQKRVVKYNFFIL
jgi:hypothetical protein